MKAKQYAVSVQYGAGYHYFIAYRDQEDEARVIMRQNQLRLDKDFAARTGPRKGARGVAHLWELKASGVDKPTEVTMVGPYSEWPRK